MQSPERKVRKPRYGIYAWPYFVLVTFLGILGMALILAGIAEGGLMLLSGVVLAAVGFYLALGHCFMIRIHEKKENVFAIELLKFLEPGDNRMILDVGSGTGRTAIAIAKNSACSKVVGIDTYSKKTIYVNSPRRAYENAEKEGVDDRTFFSYGDALNVPFKDQCLDAVTFGSVLHLFTETRQRRAIEEALRVLKAEGKLVIIEMLRTAKVALTYLVPSFFYLPDKGILDQTATRKRSRKHQNSCDW